MGQGIWWGLGATHINAWWMIGGAVAVSILLQRMWKHIVIPLWSIRRAVVRFADNHATLMEIAEEFKPNHGTSLRDVVDRIEASLGKSNEAIDLHIIDRRPDGRRKTDPRGD